MRRRTRALAGVVAVALFAGAGGCGGSSNDVRITVRVDDVGNRGTFTATGDDICAEGTFSNVDFDFVEERQTARVTFRDQYNCRDGSGVFFIVGEVDVEEGRDLLEPSEEPYEGTWSVEVESGLGDYRNATGSGTFRGQTLPEWVDEYEGEFTTG